MKPRAFFVSSAFRLGGGQGIFLLLILILLNGLALRLYGLNWDQGIGAHPDERYITSVAASFSLPDPLTATLDPHRSTLNPYVWPVGEAYGERTETVAAESWQGRSRPFSYGHLPLYLMVLAAGGDSDEARLAVVGRVLSALFDTGTILLTFALGRLIYGSAAGFLAAAFVALAVIHIQQGHFATFDTIMTFFVIATLLFAGRFARYAKARDAVAAGICLGLAVGSKFSAILLLAPLAIALMSRWECLSQLGKRRRFGLVVLVLLVAFLVFGLTNPFSLTQPGEFIRNLEQQGAMLRGDAGFPFTLQYHGTWPYLYPIEQQLRWGMGLSLGLIAFVGLGYALWREIRSVTIRPESWVPLAWTVVYYGYFGAMHAKFARYMLPVVPVLAICGATMLQACTCRVSRWCIRDDASQQPSPALNGRWLGTLFCGAFLLPTAIYALAFLSVYRDDHPWVKLSLWVYSHVPNGATIASEKWDHHLPLTLSLEGVARWPGEYNQQVLDPYSADTPEMLRVMLRQLAASDYLLLASNRLYGSTARATERYVLMQRYYQSLFDGRLGYRLVPTPDVERQPRLGPLAFVDDPFRAAGLPSPLEPDRAQPARFTLNLGHADESFTVYDHPRPLLFENVERLAPTEMESLFTDLLAAR